MAGNNDLNFGENILKEGEDKLPFNLEVLRFDPRSLFLYVTSQWRWILIFFFLALFAIWGLEKWRSVHSSTAWTAEAKILHQERSNRLPNYYQQMDTATVMQFFASRDVQGRVGDRLRSSPQYAFTPELFRNVLVSRERERSWLISIKASAGTAETAAAIANEVAEEGIAEYVRQQNSKIRSILQERSLQLTNITRELSSLQLEKKRLYTSNSVISPELELLKKNEELSLFASKKEDLLIKLHSLDISISSIKSLLEQTPEMEEGEKRIDNTRSIGVTGKKIELESLLKRYTIENPKVKILLDEIEILEKNQAAGSNLVADVIVLRKNPVYATLQNQLTALDIERKTAEVSIAQYETNQIFKEGYLQDLMNRSVAYEQLLQREEQLKSGRQKLIDSITDLEFLMSSAVPDVAIFERAKTPTVSTLEQAKFKIAGLGFFLALVFAFLIAVFRILQLKLVSSSEFEYVLDVTSLGELPLPDETSSEAKRSALQKILQNLRLFLQEHKRVGFLKFQPSESLEMDITEILNIAMISGQKTFRLKCIPAIKGGVFGTYKPLKDDVLAKELISVVKVADEGYFSFQNNFSLDSAEMDLLRFDVEALCASYDLVIIEVESEENTELLSSQIGQLSERIILSVPFDSIRKTVLQEHIKQMQEASDTKIAGLLTDVPTPYYEG